MGVAYLAVYVEISFLRPCMVKCFYDFVVFTRCLDIAWILV